MQLLAGMEAEFFVFGDRFNRSEFNRFVGGETDTQRWHALATEYFERYFVSHHNTIAEKEGCSIINMIERLKAESCGKLMVFFRHNSKLLTKLAKELKAKRRIEDSQIIEHYYKQIVYPIGFLDFD